MVTSTPCTALFTQHQLFFIILFHSMPSLAMLLSCQSTCNGDTRKTHCKAVKFGITIVKIRDLMKVGHVHMCQLVCTTPLHPFTPIPLSKCSTFNKNYFPDKAFVKAFPQGTLTMGVCVTLTPTPARASTVTVFP